MKPVVFSLVGGFRLEGGVRLGEWPPEQLSLGAFFSRPVACTIGGCRVPFVALPGQVLLALLFFFFFP